MTPVSGMTIVHCPFCGETVRSPGHMVGGLGGMPYVECPSPNLERIEALPRDPESTILVGPRRAL